MPFPEFLGLWTKLRRELRLVFGLALGAFEVEATWFSVGRSMGNDENNSKRATRATTRQLVFICRRTQTRLASWCGDSPLGSRRV